MLRPLVRAHSRAPNPTNRNELTMTLQIRQVTTAAEMKAFIQFPWTLYKDFPHWIPELPSLRRDTLDKRKHAAWEYLEGEYFLAWRDGQVVGQIAAFVNQRHNQIYDETLGCFGFFECIHDHEVAQALFQTAETFLSAKGVSAIRGPLNFSVNDTIGVLTDSFDRDPMILMPYNPPYYIELIEAAGYHKEMNLYAWRNFFSKARQTIYEADGQTEQRVVKAARRAMQRAEITVRTLNPRQKQADFQILRQIYATAWEKNWASLPLTDRELDNLVRDLGFLLLPDYTFFAYVKDQPAGFMLLIPNFNEVLSLVRPHPRRPEAWWLVQLLWHWKIRPKIKSLRVILFGVKEEYRSLGVDAALNLALGEQMMREQRGFEWVEAGWVLETNENINRLMEHFGGQMHRQHRLYRKNLSAGPK
jgi:hypothetical protein